MRLIEALNIAKACGLNTVGEAVMNISLHAVSLFPFEDLPSEFEQLESEAKSFDKDTLISEAMKQL
jgi:hypothetical protein